MRRTISAGSLGVGSVALRNPSASPARAIRALISLVFTALFLFACTGGGTPLPPLASPSPNPTASPIPAPPTTLMVCLGAEPQSLYLNSGNDLAMRTVLEAIYDGPIDSNGFGYQPVILASLPSIENKGAVVAPVAVREGDRVLNNAGVPVTLAVGETIRPAGCRDASCATTYSGGDLTMDQLTANFDLRQGIAWSDGVPLTADDSLFAFEVASSPDTPLSPYERDRLDRTLSYKVLDSLTVQWVGVPGWLDPAYMLRFQTPLPRHAYGDIAPKDLLVSELATRRPLGWGAYVIEEWQPGRYIALTKNTRYWRADEGLPYFDEMTFRFIGADADGSVAALLAGECDVVDQSVALDDRLPLLMALRDRGVITLSYTPGTAWEHIDFNLQPVTPYVYQHPPLLAEPQLRQALALCTDRTALIEALFHGATHVPASFASPLSPLANPEVAPLAYDPERGKQMLEALGWRLPTAGASTLRVASGVRGVTGGTPLRLDLYAVSGVQRRAAVEMLVANLAECGIALNVQFFDSGLLRAGSDGAVFGRQFTMAQYAWLSGPTPSCELYLGREIPSAENGWIGQNATGFSNAAYDAACESALAALPDEAAYAEGFRRAQQIFAEALPSLPLYLKLRVLAGGPDLVGLQADPTSASGMWNIEALSLSD